jgi:hypothetical protein
LIEETAGWVGEVTPEAMKSATGQKLDLAILSFAFSCCIQ